MHKAGHLIQHYFGSGRSELPDNTEARIAGCAAEYVGPDTYSSLLFLLSVVTTDGSQDVASTSVRRRTVCKTSWPDCSFCQCCLVLSMLLVLRRNVIRSESSTHVPSWGIPALPIRIENKMENLWTTGARLCCFAVAKKSSIGLPQSTPISSGRSGNNLFSTTEHTPGARQPLPPFSEVHLEALARGTAHSPRYQ